jgi:dihydrofolate synthase / folylpolyglutamate synthase
MTEPYAAVLQRLYQLLPQGRKFGLERMQAACAAFGHPERSFAAVHVAGTNGKGSVCAFVASMLRAHGLRVGLYTSPHLNRFTERVRINGDELDDAVATETLDRIMTEAPELTFFEVSTLLAFLAFRDAEVDVAVLEVGLGGRLDATNVIPAPRVAAITRVSFDHMDVLGNSLAEIAAEKAAIIKPGSEVVVGKLHPAARAVVEARCKEVGATLLPLGGPEPYPGAQLAYPRIAMFGTNLAVATTIGRTLELPPEAIARGVESTVWPGRNELLHRGGQDLTLLDCAHNPDGAVCLSQVIDSSIGGSGGSRRDVALVFGATRGKNWQSMLDRLEHSVGHRFYVRPPLLRGEEPEPMAAYKPGRICSSVREALAAARSTVGSDGLVVVAGSVFLVGAARAELLGLKSDPAADA